jgi:hypothetical protein
MKPQSSKPTAQELNEIKQRRAALQAAINHPDTKVVPVVRQKLRTAERTELKRAKAEWKQANKK